MIQYKGYYIPESLKEIRYRLYQEHWQGDFLRLVHISGDKDRQLNVLYERGTFDSDNRTYDLSAVINRCKAFIDRYVVNYIGGSTTIT